MKAAVFIILLVLLAPAAYRDPYVTIPEEVEVIAGETAHIEVLIQHVQTTMWNLRVYVDTDQIEARFLERMEIMQDNENPLLFDEEIPHGTEISAVMDIQVAANSPSGQVSIPVISVGSKGPCMKGCEPFLVQKSTTLVIKRQDPKLALMLPEARFEAYPGEHIKIEVQLKNYSAAAAYIDKLEAVPDGELTVLNQTIPGQVAAGSTESVTFTVVTGGASPGSYLIHMTVIYKDQIQNKYTDSKTVYVTILEQVESPPPPTQPPQTVNPTPEPAAPEPSEDKYLYFLAGMVTGGSTFTVAVMVGIFLKKRRPAK